MYADILKKQFTLTPTTPPDETNNRPPRKRQAAAILDYNLDCAAKMTTIVAPNAATHTGTMSSTPTTTIPINYAAEMNALKQEIADLCSIVTSAVEQIKSAIASLPTSRNPHSNEMETETETITNNPISSQNSRLCKWPKHDIATFVIETKAMFQQQANLQLTNHSMKPSYSEQNHEPVWVFFASLGLAW